MKKPVCFKTVCLLVLALFVTVTSACAAPWKFGVMADTQWTGVPDDGKNPNSVAVDIINQLNQQFISRGVKLVVAVGDVTDNGSTLALDTSAAFRQALYNAGIGFFPLRGNHESSKVAAAEFRRVFPQTQNGINNATPIDVFGVSNPDAATQPFPAKTGSAFTLGSNFSSPNSSLAGDLTGLSYAFDYNKVRFVLLDQFTPADSTSSNLNPAPNTIDKQQPWISSVLAGRPKGTHAFVFSHKGLITENHVDTLFGADPSQDAAGQDGFISSLYYNNVYYYMLGHDHMHDRSIVTTTNGGPERIHQLVCSSDSSKFYIPSIPANDTKYDLPAFGHARQTPISQELNTVGYYIFTVDGPRVTVDFYSAVVNPTLVSGEYLITTTPALNFTKRETFGYSLNGEEFVVDYGEPYAKVKDKFNDTVARILSGDNDSTATDGSGRFFSKVINTGWTPQTSKTASDILSLWGLGNLGNQGGDRSDVYALSMSYDGQGIRPQLLGTGEFGLAAQNKDGKWINAVDKNFGGQKRFVYGPWRSIYALGTYGVNPNTHTAWAVLDYDDDFAVAHFQIDTWD